MRFTASNILLFVALAASVAIHSGADAQTAQKKPSIWQQMKDAAKQAGQPAGQAQQQPGQKPGKPGQPTQAGAGQVAAGQVNDTGPFTPPPGTKIDPVVMAPVEQGSQLAVSPLGIHVATLSHSGSRAVIIYDGVAGPKFDQLFVEGGGGHPVIFSHDGNHWAYCGQQGSNWVVMEDGKELTRGSDTVNGAMGTNSCTLGFTSNSKHLFYTSQVSVESSYAANHFVFDGKATPLAADGDMRNYAFSPDGNHVAYFISKPDPRVGDPGKLWIDGKPAPYDAGSPQWSADSQHLYTMRSVRVADTHIGSVQEFLLDGKPFLRADYARLFIPPVGNMMVAIVSRLHENPPVQYLVIGGKEVPGSEVVGGQISAITFSPDGKHYAASYGNANHRAYVFCDGKKGLEYPSVTSLAYNADSSKLFYQAYDTTSGARYFVFGGEESERIPQWTTTVFAPVGGHVATTGSGFVTMDGHILKFPNVNPQSTQATALSFSPDASHWAFVLHDRAGSILYLDGVAQTAFGPINLGTMDNLNTRPYIFSPDSKHVAYFCRSTNPAAGTDIFLCLDDKAVRLGANGYYANLTFSGDSSHLFWSRNKPLGEIRIFADGQPVQDGFPISTAGFQKETWQIGADGNLLVLVEDGDSLKRISITPSPDTSLATVVGSGTTQANGN
jgi:hypothetical protein